MPAVTSASIDTIGRRVLLGCPKAFDLAKVLRPETKDKITNALWCEISISLVAYDDAKAYLIAGFKALLNSPDISYAVQSTAGGDVGREQLIFERMEKACN